MFTSANVQPQNILIANSRNSLRVLNLSNKMKLKKEIHLIVSHCIRIGLHSHFRVFFFSFIPFHSIWDKTHKNQQESGFICECKLTSSLSGMNEIPSAHGASHNPAQHGLVFEAELILQWITSKKNSHPLEYIAVLPSATKCVDSYVNSINILYSAHGVVCAYIWVCLVYLFCTQWCIVNF